MKRLLLALLILCCLAAPVFAQFRIDFGADKPIHVGLSNEDELGVDEDFDEASDFIAQQWWLFLPTASAYYQFDLEVVKLCAGIRFYSFLVIGAGWPNLMAEVKLGPLFVDAQLGGLLFGYYALNNGSIEAGKVLIPDLSVWLGLGKTKSLRLGGGIMGFYVPELVGKTDIVPYMGYLGVKISVLP